MNNIFDLTGKVALVTGGGGGIGYALALGLAEAGADVAVTSRKLEHLGKIVKDIESKGRKAMAVSADVSQEKSVAAMTDAVLKKFQHIDICANRPKLSPLTSGNRSWISTPGAPSCAARQWRAA